jgi:hypothetical protein
MTGKSGDPQITQIYTDSLFVGVHLRNLRIRSVL